METNRRNAFRLALVSLIVDIFLAIAVIGSIRFDYVTTDNGHTLAGYLLVMAALLAMACVLVLLLVRLESRVYRRIAEAGNQIATRTEK